MEPDTSPLTSEKVKRTESISNKSRTVHWAPSEVRNSTKSSQRQDAEGGENSVQPNSAMPKHQYFGPDVLIILGFVLLISGFALTMYGINTTFTLMEIEICVMGIGPSLIAIGIVFLLLRILYCKSLIALINRIKHRNAANTIHPTQVDKSMHAQESGAVLHRMTQQPINITADPPPYLGSSNVDSTKEAVKMETTNADSLGAKAVASLNENNSVSSQDYVMDELGCFSPSIDSKDATRNKVISFHKNNSEDETALLVQKLNGRKNSIEYYREFNQTVNELGLSV